MYNGKPDIYLSGGMSGHPDYNLPAFREAATRLRLEGYRVFNPGEQGADAPESAPYAIYLPADIRAVLECDAVVALPGWEQSRGALLEIGLATLLGKLVWAYPDMRLLKLSVSAKDGALTVQA